LTPDAVQICNAQRPLLSASSQWLTQYKKIIDWNRPLAVGFSGGADSTALLLILAAHHPTIEAWHIDHGWHQQSAIQAQQLADQCGRWNIVFRHQRVICNHTHNRESSARRARLQAFTEMATLHGITQLALAHHRDDQAETVLMRMLNGDGVRGCCGMSAQQTMDQITLIRPLLSISKKSIQQALLQAQVKWLHDPSNHDTSLTRNHVRLRLMPMMNKLLARQQQPSSAVQLMLRWQQQATIIAENIAKQSLTAAITAEDNCVSTVWSTWLTQSAPVRAWTLQRMTKRLLGQGTCMGRRHIELVEAWCKQGGRKGLDLSRCRLEHRNHALCLFKTGQKQ